MFFIQNQDVFDGYSMFERNKINFIKLFAELDIKLIKKLRMNIGDPNICVNFFRNVSKHPAYFNKLKEVTQLENHIRNKNVRERLILLSIKNKINDMLHLRSNISSLINKPRVNNIPCMNLNSNQVNIVFINCERSFTYGAITPNCDSREEIAILAFIEDNNTYKLSYQKHNDKLVLCMEIELSGIIITSCCKEIPIDAEGYSIQLDLKKKVDDELIFIGSKLSMTLPRGPDFLLIWNQHSEFIYVTLERFVSPDLPSEYLNTNKLGMWFCYIAILDNFQEYIYIHDINNKRMTKIRLPNRKILTLTVESLTIIQNKWLLYCNLNKNTYLITMIWINLNTHEIVDTITISVKIQRISGLMWIEYGDGNIGLLIEKNEMSRLNNKKFYVKNTLTLFWS